MTNELKEKYEALLQFIEENPAIRIRPTSVMIDSEIRPLFYEKFNDVCRQLTVDSISKEDWDNVNELITKWKEESAVVTDQLKLEGIRLDDKLADFFNDPVNMGIKMTSSAFMDVLRGISDFNTFVSDNSIIVKSAIEKHYRSGYKRWIALKIIEFVDADCIYEFPSPESNYSSSSIEGISTAYRFEEVPVLKNTSLLYFDIAEKCGYLTSKIVLHSKKFNRFVAIRPEHYEPVWIAKLRSNAQDWIDVRKINYNFGKTDLYPDMYIYVADDTRDLSILCDRYYLCRPHINIEIESDRDWLKTGGLSSAKRHAIITRPKCGTIVVSKNPVDTTIVEEQKKPQELSDSFFSNHKAVEYVYEKPEEPEVREEKSVVENNIVVEASDSIAVFSNEIEPEEMNEEEEQFAAIDEQSDNSEIAQEQETITEEEEKIFEPELDINVLYTNWNTSALEKLLDEKISQIPRYPTEASMIELF